MSYKTYLYDSIQLELSRLIQGGSYNNRERGYENGVLSTKSRIKSVYEYMLPELNLRDLNKETGEKIINDILSKIKKNAKKPIDEGYNSGLIDSIKVIKRHI